MFFMLLTNDKSYPGADYTSFKLPSFKLENLENLDTISNDVLEGDFILNVWASWCITCLVEHPFLTKLSNNDIEIIGLNYKDTDAKANAWLEKHGNPYLFSMYDPRGDLAFDLGVTGAPESYLIINNQVVGHIQGEMNQSKWETIFLPLIQKAKRSS